ncbi:MAG: hypothetical protein ACSHX6_13930 [Akkermansiaceae bacterium]
MNQPRYLIPLLLLVFLPCTASANAGTPLMWATFLHLLFGNALIGLLEGLLLAWMFRCSIWQSITILILANYLSAWTGALLFAGAIPDALGITIENISIWFFVYIFTAFVVTILIEYPFYKYALRKKATSLKSRTKGILIIHGISYLILLVWYGLASGTSMMTQLDVVNHKELITPAPCHLYYLSPEGDQLIRLDLHSPHSKKKITKLKADAPNPYDRLFLSENEDSKFDLILLKRSPIHGEDLKILLLESITKNPAKIKTPAGHFTNNIHGETTDFGAIPSLSETSEWEFNTGFWPVQGISGENKKSGKHINYSLETPFVAWPIRNATQLPGDLVVFQLGDDQICILNPISKQIALITRGKGPVVIQPTAPE